MCMCVCWQTRMYECKPSFSCFPCSVCQRKIDTDESKLDGDSVHPVRAFIIMAVVLLIIPVYLSSSVSLSVSVSISAVSFLWSKSRWAVAVLAWNTPFCLLSFSTSLTPFATPTPAHTYLLTCKHTHNPHWPASHPFVHDKTYHRASPALSKQWKNAEVMT